GRAIATECSSWISRPRKCSNCCNFVSCSILKPRRRRFALGGEVSEQSPVLAYAVLLTGAGTALTVFSAAALRSLLRPTSTIATTTAAPPNKPRKVKDSPARAHTRNTATTGLTYVCVATVVAEQRCSSQT